MPGNAALQFRRRLRKNLAILSMPPRRYTEGDCSCRSMSENIERVPIGRLYKLHQREELHELIMLHDFYTRVYAVVMRIPPGKVTTYGAIARHIGAGRSARTVGYALNAAPLLDDIPCHRVVNRNGDLSGKVHFATPTLMRELLEAEGVTFKGERVVMAEHFWDPGPPVGE